MGKHIGVKPKYDDEMDMKASENIINQIKARKQEAENLDIFNLAILISQELGVEDQVNTKWWGASPICRVTTFDFNTKKGFRIRYALKEYEHVVHWDWQNYPIYSMNWNNRSEELTISYKENIVYEKGYTADLLSFKEESQWFNTLKYWARKARKVQNSKQVKKQEMEEKRIRNEMEENKKIDKELNKQKRRQLKNLKANFGIN